MEIKKLNLEVITLFEKIIESLNETARTGKEQVNTLEHKIDHIITMLDQFKYRSEYLKHLGEHPLSKKNTN